MYVVSLLTFCLPLSIFSPLAAQEYFYTEVTDNTKTNLQITKKETEDGTFLITMKDDHRDSRHYFEPEGYTIRWEHSDTQLGHDFDVVRSGDKIAIKGTFQGKPIDKIVDIDESVWMNKVDHALSSWVRSDDEEVEFWILKLSSDLDPLKIRAEKVGHEILKLNQKTFLTIKVKLTLCGFFLSHLWSSYYWYREEDGLFLKFRGAMGRPGTPLTTIELTPLAGNK
jgi:hypothetical protein